MIEGPGRDAATGSCRVAIDTGAGRIVGRLPEMMIVDALPPRGGRGHQTAHRWIERNQTRLVRAIETLTSGGRPPVPFDRLCLEEDA